jgi:hypothetical protein
MLLDRASWPSCSAEFLRAHAECPVGNEMSAISGADALQNILNFFIPKETE